MLQLWLCFNFVKMILTEAELIEKTLFTFLASALILYIQYCLNVYCQATFNQLINLLQEAEKHDTIMMNNNFRPVGTKRVPKVNYGKNGRKRTRLPTNDSSL